jgi:hypothetical protein
MITQKASASCRAGTQDESHLPSLDPVLEQILTKGQRSSLLAKQQSINERNIRKGIITPSGVWDLKTSPQLYISFSPY